MPDKERSLVVEIPRPAEDSPAWSRVGVVGAIGFVVGILWPRLAGLQMAPNVPGDARGPELAASAPAAAAAPAPSGAPAASGSAAAPANRQLVIVGDGQLVRCSDKKYDTAGVQRHLESLEPLLVQEVPA